MSISQLVTRQYNSWTHVNITAGHMSISQLDTCQYLSWTTVNITAGHMSTSQLNTGEYHSWAQVNITAGHASISQLGTRQYHIISVHVHMIISQLGILYYLCIIDSWLLARVPSSNNEHILYLGYLNPGTFKMAKIMQVK